MSSTRPIARHAWSPKIGESNACERGQAEVRRAKKETFGELITADCLTRRDEAGCPDYAPGEEVLEDAQSALVISDSCTEFLGVYPQGPRSKDEAKKSFRHDQG